MARTAVPILRRRVAGVEQRLEVVRLQAMSFLYVREPLVRHVLVAALVWLWMVGCVPATSRSAGATATPAVRRDRRPPRPWRHRPPTRPTAQLVRTWRRRSSPRRPHRPPTPPPISTTR